MSDAETSRPAEQPTAGEVLVAFLETCEVKSAFGVISIHNMPVLDAIARRNALRFVPARTEAGAVSMADANARVSGGIGVAVTSTGTAAGNACGAMVEALTAGTPVLHITGQIEVDYLDRNRGYIHEARDQLAMLRSVSKAAWRIWSPDTLLGILKEAVRTALTPPTGPVSIEIPIDVQEALMDWPADFMPVEVPLPLPTETALDALADALAEARRPMVWLGGGARHAGFGAAKLAEYGFGVVTSVQGRGSVPEDFAMSLGAFNLQPAIEEFYRSCDAMLVVGSRLRGNETLKYTLDLPRPLYQIDADPAAENRSYKTNRFVHGDSAITLAGLAKRLEGRMKIDPAFADDLADARAKAEKSMRDTLGPYNAVLNAVQAAAPDDLIWVRDITLSNSTWGNRLPRLTGSRDGVHALGGGIGLGVPMGIGAALAANGRKTLTLAGDGGFAISMTEIATAIQEQADVVFLVMNDRGYGVIRNIQDSKYGGRQNYADLHTPDFSIFAESLELPYWRVDEATDLGKALVAGFIVEGPAMIEVDMRAVGPFAQPFAGPPVRT